MLLKIISITMVSIDDFNSLCRGHFNNNSNSSGNVYYNHDHAVWNTCNCVATKERRKEQTSYYGNRYNKYIVVSQFHFNID